MYQAAQERYSTLPYRRCGDSGLLLPAVSLGLWHNFGDTAQMCIRDRNDVMASAMRLCRGGFRICPQETAC